MKTLLPAVALLLGGAAFLARGENPTSPSPVKPLRSSAEKAAASVAVEPAAEPAAADASVAPAAAVVPPAPKRADALAGFFKTELILTEEQARGIEGILDDRARAVSEYEAEVHQRGWFRIEDFDHRVGELRGLSYRRIASLLDAEQARRFEGLWPERLLAKDCIVISLPDELVVTLD